MDLTLLLYFLYSLLFKATSPKTQTLTLCAFMADSKLPTPTADAALRKKSSSVAGNISARRLERAKKRLSASPERLKSIREDADKPTGVWPKGEPSPSRTPQRFDGPLSFWCCSPYAQMVLPCRPPSATVRITGSTVGWSAPLT